MGLPIILGAFSLAKSRKFPKTLVSKGIFDEEEGENPRTKISYEHKEKKKKITQKKEREKVILR